MRGHNAAINLTGNRSSSWTADFSRSLTIVSFDTPYHQHAFWYNNFSVINDVSRRSGCVRHELIEGRNAPKMSPKLDSFKHTLILSTATPNTDGMNTYSHNAFLKKGVPERSVWIVLKNALLSVTRSKGELISQKSGHRSPFLTQPHRQLLPFDAIQSP